MLFKNEEKVSLWIGRTVATLVAILLIMTLYRALGKVHVDFNYGSGSVLEEFLGKTTGGSYVRHTA